MIRNVISVIESNASQSRLTDDFIIINRSKTPKT